MTIINDDDSYDHTKTGIYELFNRFYNSIIYIKESIYNFFESFGDNIVGNSIILLFIGYILGKVIEIFNINYNINR
tara:strand:- start:122 stop:349 length:228 start_codon:yes stop_codon:yes gene_type:complete